VTSAQTPEVQGPSASIRRYANGHVGTTAFFRNRPLLRELTALLAARGSSRCRVLFHACSIGAEPYSFALWCLHHRLLGAPSSLEITAADIDHDFLAIARAGVYPADVLGGLSPEEQAWFERLGDEVRIPEAARRMVTFLPPTSFVDQEPEGTYDAVLIMNALTYVTAAQQRTAILRAARHTGTVLGLTAFHPDTIRDDIEAAGLVPWMGSREPIHHAWSDRLVDGPVDRSSPSYSFQLPWHMDHDPDAAYRYCALFVRPAGSDDVPQPHTHAQEMSKER